MWWTESTKEHKNESYIIIVKDGEKYKRRKMQGMINYDFVFFLLKTDSKLCDICVSITTMKSIYIYTTFVAT